VIGEALYAGLIGTALGAATGIPLGVVNVAVLEAAARVGRRHAAGIGAGGAIADALHAAVAFAGAAPILARQPALLRILAAVSAVVIVVYAIVVWRARPAPATGAAAPARRGGFARGLAVGISLTLPNPAPLLAWVAVAGAVLPDASTAAALVGAAGVGVGSAAWFALLAHLASRGVVGDGALRWLPRAAAIALIAVAAISLARVL